MHNETHICIYSCSVALGVSEPAQKQLVDGNKSCVTNVQGGLRDCHKLQKINMQVVYIVIRWIFAVSSKRMAVFLMSCVSV